MKEVGWWAELGPELGVTEIVEGRGRGGAEGGAGLRPSSCLMSSCLKRDKNVNIQDSSGCRVTQN